MPKLGLQAAGETGANSSNFELEANSSIQQEAGPHAHAFQPARKSWQARGGCRLGGPALSARNGGTDLAGSIPAAGRGQRGAERGVPGGVTTLQVAGASQRCSLTAAQRRPPGRRQGPLPCPLLTVLGAAIVRDEARGPGRQPLDGSSAGQGRRQRQQSYTGRPLHGASLLSVRQRAMRPWRRSGRTSQAVVGPRGHP